MGRLWAPSKAPAASVAEPPSAPPKSTPTRLSSPLQGASAGRAAWRMHKERYATWTAVQFTSPRLRCVAYRLNVRLQSGDRDPFKEWCDLYKQRVAVLPQGEFEELVMTLQGMPGRKRAQRRSPPRVVSPPTTPPPSDLFAWNEERQAGGEAGSPTAGGGGGARPAEVARLEAVRLEGVRLEADRLETDRLEGVRLEAVRLEAVRLERRFGWRRFSWRRLVQRGCCWRRLGRRREEWSREVQLGRGTARWRQLGRRDSGWWWRRRRRSGGRRQQRHTRIRSSMRRGGGGVMGAGDEEGTRLEAVRREADRQRVEATREEELPAEAALKRRLRLREWAQQGDGGTELGQPYAPDENANLHRECDTFRQDCQSETFLAAKAYFTTMVKEADARRLLLSQEEAWNEVVRVRALRQEEQRIAAEANAAAGALHAVQLEGGRGSAEDGMGEETAEEGGVESGGSTGEGHRALEAARSAGLGVVVEEKEERREETAALHEDQVEYEGGVMGEGGDGGEGGEEGTAGQGEGGGEGGGAGDGVEALGAGALGPVLPEGGVRGWDGEQETEAASREAARRAKEMEEWRELAAEVVEQRKEEANRRGDEPTERRGVYHEPAVEDAQYMCRRATEDQLAEKKLLKKLKRNLNNGPDSASPSARENVWCHERELETKVGLREKWETVLYKLVAYDALVQLEMAAQGKDILESVPALERRLLLMRSQLEEWDQCDAARAAMRQATSEEGQTGGRALPADQVAYGVGVEAGEGRGESGGGQRRKPTSDERHAEAASRREEREESRRQKTRENREEADALSAQGTAQKVWLNVFVSGARVGGEFGVVVVQSADEEDPLLLGEGELLWKSGGKGGGRRDQMLDKKGADLSGILRAIHMALQWQGEHAEWREVQMRFFVPREARLIIQCFDQCVPHPCNSLTTLKGGNWIKDQSLFWSEKGMSASGKMEEVCREVFRRIKCQHLEAIFREERHGGGMMGASQFMRDANGEAFTRGGNKYTSEEIVDKKRRASQKVNSEKPDRPRRVKKKAGESSDEGDSEYGGNSEEDRQRCDKHMNGSSDEESLEGASGNEDDDDDEDGGEAGSCDDYDEEG